MKDRPGRLAVTGLKNSQTGTANLAPSYEWFDVNVRLSRSHGEPHVP
jgi:hypothetical protein